MRVPGVYRLKRAARRFRNRFRPTALVLLYHRIIDLPSDPQLLCVTKKHFAEHLEVLKKRANVISLKHLNQNLHNQNLIGRSVVVTFDDGYADNFHNAKPLLEQFDIPATVFVASGYLENQSGFWWDELDRLLLEPGTLPNSLRLSINGNEQKWELKNWSSYSEADYQRYQPWNVLDKNDPTSRQSIYRSLHLFLRPFSDKERRNVLDQLRTLAGTKSEGRPSHRTLSVDEIFRLDKGGLIEIGSHTVTHPVLSKLSSTEQRFEIQKSKIDLEEIVGHPIASFAYPYGSKDDYTDETVDFVRKTGFECACSNFFDIVHQGIGHFQLPRVLIRDWDGKEFERQLEQWFLG